VYTATAETPSRLATMIASRRSRDLCQRCRAADGARDADGDDSPVRRHSVTKCFMAICFSNTQATVSKSRRSRRSRYYSRRRGSHALAIGVTTATRRAQTGERWSGSQGSSLTVPWLRRRSGPRGRPIRCGIDLRLQLGGEIARVVLCHRNVPIVFARSFLEVVPGLLIFIEEDVHLVDAPKSCGYRMIPDRRRQEYAE